MSCLRAAVLLALVALARQATTGCKNCMMLGKAERAMFLAHSAACAAQSRAPAPLVQALLRGELADRPEMRRHVYCVLLKCKLIGKDGKLLKAALRAKAAARPDARNLTKVWENCADQSGTSPEDVAWNLFRCGLDKKAVLFEFMPAGGASSGDIDNTS